jgi:hypothetical protein
VTGGAAAVLLLLAAASIEDHVESRRLRAPVVYVGTVAEVTRVGNLDVPQVGRMEASLKDVKVLKGAPPPEGAGTVVLRYDHADEPIAGGLFYRVAPGDVVVVFARSLGKEYPMALVNGTAKVVGDDLRARREWLAALDADGLRVQGVTEAQRPDQVRLYDRILGALGLPLK